MTRCLPDGQTLKEHAEKHEVSYRALAYLYDTHGPASIPEHTARLIKKKANSNIKTDRIPINVGDMFGALEVIEELPRTKTARVFRCLCHNCGRYKDVEKPRLISKNQPLRSCGCLRGKNGLIYGDLYTAAAANEVPLSTVRRIAKQHGLEVAFQYAEQYGGNKTSLEIICSSMLRIEKHTSGIKMATGKYRYPDFKISDTVYLDVDGLAYHTVERRGVGYHAKKREEYSEIGLQLIQVHGDEVATKPEIVKSILAHASGNTSTKIAGRKCAIVEVSNKDAAEFFSNNHLMGHYPASKSIGLQADGVLVAVMSYAKYSKFTDIKRFCTLINTSVQGGFSKLLKHLIKIENPKKIVNYVDLRYGTGKHLESLGFRHVKTHIGVFYTDGFKKVSRQTLIKRPAGMSQKEYAEELKLKKVEDAGQAKFIREI